jgi:hypothetical protein
MFGAKAFRRQHLNFLSQQLASTVSKQPLRLAIDQDNLSLSICYDYRIRRCFQQLSKLAFCRERLCDGAEVFLRLPPLSDVPGNAGKPEWPSALAVIDFPLRDQKPSRAIRPHDAEFALVAGPLFD